MSRHWWSADRSTVVLVLLGILLGVVTVLMVLPFLQWILIGMLLAYVLLPIENRLSKRFGPALSVAGAMLVGLVAVLVPVFLVVGVAIEQAGQLTAAFDPHDVSRIDDEIRTRTGIPIDLTALQASFSSTGTTGAGGLLGNVVSIVGGIPEVLIGLVVLAFTLFYLLKDGQRASAWLREMIPLEPEIRDELLDEVDRLLWATLVGSAVVATVQSLLIGIAFFVLGISGVVLWVVVTFLASLIPAVGATLVWLPTSIYLVVTGRPVAGVAMLLFGAAVVSTIDNVLRPLVVERGAQLNPALGIVGIFGGVILFGPVGLFVGPVMLGTAKRLVEIIARDHPEATQPSG